MPALYRMGTSFKTRDVNKTFPPSRRTLLKQIAGAGMCLPLTRLGTVSWAAQVGVKLAFPAPFPEATSLAAEDDPFLDELERLNSCFFWEQANPQTGLIRDRSKITGNDN